MEATENVSLFSFSSAICENGRRKSGGHFRERVNFTICIISAPQTNLRRKY